MSAFIRSVQAFLTSESGPTAAEYAIMLGLIVFVIIAVVSTLGSKVSSSFASVLPGMPS